MKTSELQGAELDYWVARVEGLETPEIDEYGCSYVHHYEPGDDGWWMQYRPSVEWEVGGPIIQREKLELTPLYDMRNRFVCWSSQPVGIGHLAMDDEYPLMAAMRAYVASKFGNEVPDDKESK